MAIQSFKDERCEALHNLRKPGKGFPQDVVRSTQRKLVMLHAADSLDDLRSPPGNHLEALKDDRGGQYAIRVNDQFRLCFIWTEHGPADVEFVDYH